MNDLHTRFFKDGKLVLIPRKQKDKLALLEYLMTLFTSGVTYTEKEVNDIIRQVYSGHATLRRYLVDYQLLERQSDGRTYSVCETMHVEK